MLAVESKKTDKVELTKPLADYVAEHFPEQAESFAEPLKQLSNLREALRNSTDKTEATRDQLLRYYGMLCALERRFPIGEESDQIRIKFIWYDAFKGKKKERYSLAYEKANTLFNIAATISQIAVLISRDTPEGLKRSASYFQTAAGTYEQLREFMSSRANDAVTPDLSPDALQMLSTLLLAQAQQCFLQKAIKDGMKPPSLSKLSSQISEYYDQALALLMSPALKGIDNSWSSACSLLSATFSAMSYYQISVQMLQEEKYGEQVSYLLAAASRFDGISAQLKNVPDDISEFVTRHQGLVGKALASAERDNDTIYHELVPTAPGGLPRHSMVKCTRLEASQLVLPIDPFAALVPFHVTAAASVYSERKAELIRSEGRAAEEQNDLAKKSLASMNLPGSILALEQPSGLPPALAQVLDKLRLEQGEMLLAEQMQSVDDASRRTAESIAAAEKTLNDEEDQDKRLKAQYPDKWRRSPSYTLTANLKQELGKLRANLDAARKADVTVRQKHAEHAPMLRRLCGPASELQGLLPDAAPAAIGPYNTTKLRNLLSQLENIVAGRQTLLSQLKAQSEKDDITDQLMESGAGAPELVYAEQLRKYSPIQQKIAENVSQQAQILSAISAENDQFVAHLKQSPAGRQREAAIQSLDGFFRAYGELKANLKEGLQFYKNMNDDAGHFRAKVDDFVMARQIEMQDALTAIQKPETQPSPPQMQPWRPHAPAAAAAPPPYGTAIQQPSPYPTHMQAVAPNHAAPQYMQMHTPMAVHPNAGVPPPYGSQQGGIVYAVPSPGAQQLHQQWGTQLPPGYQAPPPAYNPYGGQ